MFFYQPIVETISNKSMLKPFFSQLATYINVEKFNHITPNYQHFILTSNFYQQYMKFATMK